MKLFQQVYYLVKKELTLEWRSKYALNGILLYVISTVFVCYLSFKRIDPPTWNALFWIILLFASINAVGKSFIQETRGRQLYYYMLNNPQSIILSKILYNLTLVLLLGIICLGFYTIVFNNPMQDPGLYFFCVFAGSLSFANVFTMVSAIASRANQNTTLMAILGFPVILPLLLLLIRLSKNAMDGLDRTVSINELLAILFINIIVVAVSLLLFPYIWRD